MLPFAHPSCELDAIKHSYVPTRQRGTQMRLQQLTQFMLIDACKFHTFHDAGGIALCRRNGIAKKLNRE